MLTALRPVRSALAHWELVCLWARPCSCHLIRATCASPPARLSRQTQGLVAASQQQAREEETEQLPNSGRAFQPQRAPVRLPR